MHSSRRSFLGLLASALVLDPERLLWVPGKKLVSIAKLRNPVIRIIEINHKMSDAATLINVGEQQFRNKFRSNAASYLQDRELFSVGGQTMFPVAGGGRMDYELAGTTKTHTYVMAKDFNSRLEEAARFPWDSIPDVVLHA